MAIGIYLSIGGAYLPEAASDAAALLESVNRALAKVRIKPIDDLDPAPLLESESRTTLTLHSARDLVELGDVAGDDRPHTRLLRINPYRLVYVPREIGRPIALDHTETLGKKTMTIMLGSASALHRELLSLATDLDVPLTRDGTLDDAVAAKLNARVALRPDESQQLVEELRAAWLTMFEAARVSSERGYPICLG